MMAGAVPVDALRDIEAVVFDFDGTLAVLNIDFPAMRESVRHLAEDFRIPPGVLDDLFVLETIEAGRAWLAAERPARAESFHREAMDLVAAIEMRAARGGALIGGVRELLGEMGKRRIRRAVITRNCEAAVLLIVPDLSALCDAFLPREAVLRVKPHPEHLLESLARMHADPSRSVMVGDHPMDIRTGKEAGTRTVGVLTGSAQREELARAGADFVIPSVADLLPLPG